ncbi:cre-cal-1 protein [Stylonychia lemnae]|uniref:Cre-cal-1 protein n=1 Tax=Stylonychia lemnae TaxID=5949 RepID=A0A077ZW24_STYLE|nr:cre-cal-1 protein [Stylonychia lemnae]|eukprot:CDW72646.1 cre-cal-1 protein [Stylonychia lemnae]
MENKTPNIIGNKYMSPIGGVKLPLGLMTNKSPTAKVNKLKMQQTMVHQKLPQKQTTMSRTKLNGVGFADNFQYKSQNTDYYSDVSGISPRAGSNLQKSIPKFQLESKAGKNYDSFEEFIKTLGCADIKGMVMKFRAFSGYYGEKDKEKERQNLQEFFKIADKDGNGDISFEEFQYFGSQIILIEGISQASEEQMYDLFKKIDVDQDETVSFHEMFNYWCLCCADKLAVVEEEARNRGIDV